MFITIEGMDGSGKGSQIERIKKYLEERDVEFISLREPGSTKVAELVREIIVNEDIDEIQETMLFAVARRDLLKNVIIPNLTENKLVLCDRYIDSSVAYQGYGRGLGIEKVMDINKTACGGEVLMPNYTIFLDLEPKIGLKRIAENNRESNRLDNEAIDFYKKCRDGFLELAKKNPNRYIIINANQSIDKVFQDIKLVLDRIFKEEEN